MRRCAANRTAAIGPAQPARVGTVHDLGPADHAGKRITARQSLGDGHHVRLDIVVLDRKQPARAGKTRLHLVTDQQDAVFVTEFTQAFHKALGRDIKTALALNRLDDHGRDTGRLDLPLEQARQRGQGVRFAHAMMFNGERGLINLRRKRAEARLVRHDLAGQPHGQHGTSVKRPREGDNGRTRGMVAGDLDSVLHRLGPGGHQQGLGVPDWRGPVEPFGERDISLVGRDLKGRVREPLILCRDRLDQPRMRMAGVGHGNARGKIDIAPAVRIPQFGVLRPLDKDRRGRGHAARHRIGAAPEKF